MLIRKEAARLLKISPGTLAVWDCTGRYHLHPVKLAQKVYYQKRDLICHLLLSEDMTLLDEPLLTRQEAALFLDKTCGTLAVWDCLNRYDLSPIRVGSCIRYSRTYLINFLNQQMEEKYVLRTAA
ncbi:hypothetical protein [Arsenicibacter rosenii]|uniref:hypothetical protein n=1 Tax=Arsenicibacter rosenii TaxID=1750698 RepID=UPI001E51DBA5|nr:hypothetical protein [Arsenicibacter rosenii]